MAVVPSPQVDLCTVDEVVNFLGGSAPGEDGLEELQFLVTACSAAAASFCSREFISQPYTEVRDGKGTALLVLRNAPITAVTSVKIGATAVAQGIGGGDTGYLLDGNILYLLGGAIFPRAVQNVCVAYTAGYTPVQDPDSTVPFDLRQAIVEAVSVTFKRRQNLGVSSKTIAGESITYILSQWPASSKAVLSYYQRAAYD